MSFQNRMCCGRREGGKCLVAKEHDRELTGRCDSVLGLASPLLSEMWVCRAGFSQSGGWILRISADVFRRGWDDDAVQGPSSAPTLQCDPECAGSGLQEMCGKNSPSSSSPHSWCCSFFSEESVASPPLPTAV